MVPQTSSQTPRRDKMYCRNCGKELVPGAELCINCGVRPLNANKFCQNCGAETRPEQEVCLKCGTLLKREEKHEPLGRKNKLIALLLCLFVAPLGVHRYYMGRVGSGVAMLLLYFSIFVFLFMGSMRSFPEPVWIGLLVFGAFALVGYMVWWIIDLISIATGKMKDGEGREFGKAG
ncbi:TM2 domain-containing protein [candidate division WOR-3 bacterium]|nr:TM2 domain-containing protein [candidate division WOR-3 bacterium]